MEALYLEWWWLKKNKIKNVVVSQCSVVCMCVCGRKKKEEDEARRKKKGKEKRQASTGGFRHYLSAAWTGTGQSEQALPPPAGLAGSGQGCDSHLDATVIGRHQPHPLPRRTQEKHRQYAGLHTKMYAK